MRPFKNRQAMFFSLLALTSVFASAAKTPVICKQAYALCSAAKCIPDPRHTHYAICDCDNFEGLSAGTISCKKRKPYTDPMHVKHVVSTFSFKHANLTGMHCPSGTVWSNCVNAPCAVDPDNAKKSICSCPLVKKGEVLVFGARCYKASCNTHFWSAALTEDNNFLGEALAKASPNKKKPSFKMCA